MAAYSSVLAWKIPWAEASGGLQTIACTETTACTQLKERSKKRKRNEKKGPMEGTSSIGR